MKVPIRQIKTEKQLNTSQNTNNVKSGLKAGKRFSAIIVSVDGENVSLEVNGKIINAKNTSSDKLFSGSHTQFEVLKSSDELIEIRPIALSSLSSPENDFNFVKSNLIKLGINFSSDNAEILAQMIKMGVPISKSTFTEVKQLFFATQKLTEALFSDQNKGRNIEFKNSNVSKDIKQLIDLIFTNSKDLLTDKPSLNKLQDFIFKNLELSNLDNKIIDKNINNDIFSQENTTKIPENKTLLSQTNLKNPDIVTTLSSDLKSVNIKNETDFIKTFLDAFKNAASSKDKLINNLVFLNKTGIKPSIFNLAVNSDLLNGKQGFSKAITELLSNSVNSQDIKSLDLSIKNFLKNSLKLSEIVDKLDGKTLEENMKSFKLLNEELSKLEITEKSSKNFEQLSFIKENTSLIKDMQPLWQGFLIPMINKSNIDDIEMYVKKDGSGSVKYNNSDDRVIYLSLKTENIERVKTRIDYSKKDLKIIFVLENEKLRDYAKNMIDSFKSRLCKISNKKVYIAVNADEFNTNLVDFELAVSFRSNSNIDVRV